MKTWEWWLEPILFPIGKLISEFHVWRHDYLAGLYIKEKISYDDWIKKSFWGLPVNDKYPNLLEDSIIYAKDKLASNDHNSNDMLEWYKYFYILRLALIYFFKKN